MFQVIVSSKVERSLKRYGDVRSRILEMLVTLRENPVPADYYDVKRVKGEKDIYRVRIDDMRLI